MNSVLACLIALPLLLAAAHPAGEPSAIDGGFFNLNFGTLKTRASKISDMSGTSSDFKTAPDTSLQMPLSLYPNLSFMSKTENSGDELNFLVYITTSERYLESFCTPDEFSLGVWRLNTSAGSTPTYSKVQDLALRQCSDLPFSFRFACCEFDTPSDALEGDILGILYAPGSTLIHEVASSPQIEVLFGPNSNTVTPLNSEQSKFSEEDSISRQGYPLVTFKPNLVSNVISFELLVSLYIAFVGTPINFGSATEFTCEGQILSWYIGGVPMNEVGNDLTLQLNRPSVSSDNVRSILTVDTASISIEDIVQTKYPNVYKITIPRAQFVFQEGDYVSISTDNTEFVWYSVWIDDVIILKNVVFSDTTFGVTMNLPLLSLEVASNDCYANTIFYDPNTLADRALAIQVPRFAPLSNRPVENVNDLGHTYFFPNLTFSEDGYIFTWRFGARVINNNDMALQTNNIRYPQLQVWRPNGRNFTLVASSSHTVEPELQLGAVHVYRYDVNLTYQAGDILAVHQPPTSSKYLLAFVDSSNFQSPLTAYELPNTTFKDLEIGRTVTDLHEMPTYQVEPMMNVLSTSMPDDTKLVITFSNTSFDRQITDSNGTRTVAFIVSFTVIGVALVAVVIFGLVLALVVFKRRYKTDFRRNRAGRRNLQQHGDIDSASYAVIRSTVIGAANRVQNYEIPMQSPLPTASSQSPSLELSSPPSFRNEPAHLPLLAPNFRNPAQNKGLAYEEPKASVSSNGLSRGQAQAVLSTTDVVKANANGGGSKSLEPSYENSDIGIYDCEEEIYEDILYVPTEKEREGFNSISNIYYTIRENQRSDRVTESAGTFFQETDRYWEPANKTSELYEQMANRRYREIARNQIQQSACLGSGQFGKVFKGLWTRSKEEVEVAIKILRNDVEEKDRVRFLQEGAIIGQFQHPNVVTLHGMVTIGEPIMIVLEYLTNGDLHNYLNKNRAKIKKTKSLPKTLLGFCQNVAAGMEYLSSKSFVHRDLAARNILLAENQTCKIADFGMSRDLEQEDYYISHGGMVPVKWTSPEAIMYRKYSTGSDVWSFGVLMYEIWSLGYKPFTDFNNVQVVQLVKEGHRLKPPAGCPREIYKLMMTCWHPESSSRPSFVDLSTDLYKLELELRSRMNHKHSNREFGRLGDPPQSSEKEYADLQKMYMPN